MSTPYNLLDFFAAHIPATDVVALVQADAEKLIGKKRPSKFSPEQIAWSFEVEAKLRFMFAKAMLKESARNPLP